MVDGEGETLGALGRHHELKLIAGGELGLVRFVVEIPHEGRRIEELNGGDAQAAGEWAAILQGCSHLYRLPSCWSRSDSLAADGLAVGWRRAGRRREARGLVAVVQAAWKSSFAPLCAGGCAMMGSANEEEKTVAKLDTQDRKEISAKKYAFPKERKEPLENAAHVRNAIARFNQVEGVSDAEKDAAWKRIKTAAKKFGVEMDEASRKELKPSKQK
jgi:hypothetical protein